MAYSSRPTSMMPGAGLRQPSSQPSPALSTRIAAKKAELENLRQLRDLSGTLAMQMQALESKIATLKDGTEGSSHLHCLRLPTDSFPSGCMRPCQLGQCPPRYQSRLQ